jgi:hypothetical protein
VIHPSDLAKIKAQVHRNPSAVWPAQLAAEWDLSEETARRMIRWATR